MPPPSFRNARSFGIALLSAIAVLGLMFSGSLLRGEGKQPAPPPPASPSNQVLNAKIVYTGGLLGYFRIPDKQLMNLKSCADAPPNDPPSPEAQKFEKIMHGLKSGNTILVGTGDNFAPELNSRMIYQGSELHHKDDYFYGLENGNKEWIWNNLFSQKSHPEELKEVPMDNVGCFLVTEGFDAVVPGVHDFFYGPERLRELAKFLAEPKVGRPVRMLAANLIEETAFANDHKPLPDSQKHLQFYAIKDKVRLSKVSDKGKVFPWLKEIDFQFKKESDSPVKGNAPLKEGDISKVCLYSMLPDDPDRFAEPSSKNPITCIGNSQSWHEKEDSADLVGDLDKQEGTIYDFQLLDPLHGGSNYAFCFQPKSSNKPYCARFTTYQPFLPSKWQNGVQQGDDKCQTRHMPCLERRLENGTSVVIFGVVEHEMPDYIGSLNYAWRNMDRHYKTEVSATDPAEALRGEMEYFKGWLGLKILLAHMPGGQAQRLAATLGGFDVVISLADTALFTTEEEVTFNVKRTGDKKGPPLFTAVPRNSYHVNSEEKEKFEVAVQSLEFTRAPLPDSWDKVSISTSTKREPVSPKTSPDIPDWFKKGVEWTLKNFNGPRSSAKPCQKLKDCRSDFAQLVEESLRRRANADVVLIQKRDIYWPSAPFVQDDPMEATIERLLWKGDFLYVARIPGKTLTQMLTESKSFAAADKNSVSEEHVTNRDLDYVGIDHDEETDQYSIDGVSLDPNRLYTVATTDYVGLGDTGYPELASTDVGHPAREANLPERLERVAAIVYENMVSHQPSTACKSATSQQYPECVVRDNYFDDNYSKPTDTRPGNTPTHALQEWALSAWPRKPPKPPSTIEMGVQQRPVWGLSLQNGSVTFSANRHELTEAEQQTTFGGVPLPEVTTPEGHTWGVDQQITLMRAGKVGEWYLSDQATYLDQVNRQPTAPTQTTQKSNLLSFEGGVRLHPSKTRPHAVLVLAPLYLETQLVNPITIVKVAVPGGAPGSTQPFDFQQGRTENWLPRVGGRYENRKSWFEFGYEQGPQLNAVQAFDFHTPSGLVTCVPTATYTLQKCVTKNPQITPSSTETPVYETKGRRGLYSDAQLQVPLPAKLTYTVRNQAEYFLGNPKDNSTDTLYVDRLTNSVSIPVFGNLALKPEFDLFLFENKVDLNHYWEYQTLISLDFTFDWYRGNGWFNALKYKNSKTAGSQ